MWAKCQNLRVLMQVGTMSRFTHFARHKFLAARHFQLFCTPGPETPSCTQTVNLTGNRLPNLHGRTFDGNVRRTLRNLYLAHNLLTSVPRFCHWEKSWYTVYCMVFDRFCMVLPLREALAGLEDLSLLDLSHNMINKVDRSRLMMIS